MRRPSSLSALPLPFLLPAAVACCVSGILCGPSAVIAGTSELGSLTTVQDAPDQPSHSGEAGGARTVEGPPPERPATLRRSSLEVWSLGWFSTGSTKWSHDASGLNPFAGNPSSTLDYQDLNSSIMEFGVQYRAPAGWFLRGSYGRGSIGSGTLVDDDFLSATGAAALGASVQGEHLVSRTHSEINGDSSLWYITADFGARLLPLENRGGLDAFVGLQFWREHYEAFGITQIVCTTPVFCLPAGSSAVPGVKVISNTVEWFSFRIGMAADYQVSRLQLQGRAAVIPYTNLFNEDTHHLRSDLRQPSATMRGTGVGAEAEFALAFRVVSELYLNLGYRVRWMSIYDGDLTNHDISGQDDILPLNEFYSLRHGVTVGASYRF